MTVAVTAGEDCHLQRGSAPAPRRPSGATARYVEAAVDGIHIACPHAPNGNPQPGPKFDDKLAWHRRFALHAAELVASGLPERGALGASDHTPAWIRLDPGLCPSGLLPLYRLYDDGRGGAPNHRYTLDLAVRSIMVAFGWTPGGIGPSRRDLVHAGVKSA